MTSIPFHRSSLAYICWDEYAAKLQRLNSFQGGLQLQEQLAERCKQFCGGDSFYFVNSGTAALELALMSMRLKSGDEVILPSLTFSSCANAVLRAGGVPCFTEVSLPDLHITLENILPLVTKRTKAIMVVEYAGTRAQLSEIRDFCAERNIILILDAAQSFSATGVHDQSALADFVCYSFHDTKVFSCGEGGLLIVNNRKYVMIVDIMFEKGTDRRAYFNGKIDKYSWQDTGSSFILSDVSLLLLSMQLDKRDNILTDKQSAINLYKKFFNKYDGEKVLAFSQHDRSSNGHIFWLLLKDLETLHYVQTKLSEQDINSSTHYIPLHSSPHSLREKFQYASDMSLTTHAGQCLLRLPVINKQKTEKITNTLNAIL